LKKNQRWLIQLLEAMALVVLAATIVVDPAAAFNAAVMGLGTWWNIVLPALLPFFVISEIASGLGLVALLGVLLEPVMRPLFNVPGSGAFVMAMGYTSGAPIGAKLTADLYRQGLCTKHEAERLISFTSNASPLFMLVAVAVGMLKEPAAGWLILGSHYIANLITGFLLRYYHAEAPTAPPHFKGSLFLRAVRELAAAREHDGRSIGQLLGEATRNSMVTLTGIGGFIIFFAVLIQSAGKLGLIALLGRLFGLILLPLGFDPELMAPLGSGFFEMTIGSKLASESAAPLNQKAALITMMLGWSGLSVQAQALSMIAGTDLSFRPFIAARLFQGTLGGIFAYLAFGLVKPVFSSAPPAAIGSVGVLAQSILAVPVLLAILILISLLLFYLRRLKIYWLKI